MFLPLLLPAHHTEHPVPAPQAGVGVGFRGGHRPHAHPLASLMGNLRKIAVWWIRSHNASGVNNNLYLEFKEETWPCLEGLELSLALPHPQVGQCILLPTDGGVTTQQSPAARLLLFSGDAHICPTEYIQRLWETAFHLSAGDQRPVESQQSATPETSQKKILTLQLLVLENPLVLMLFRWLIIFTFKKVCTLLPLSENCANKLVS